MKKSSTLFLLAGILFCSSSYASGKHTDSANLVLKTKMELMEKHIHNLQSAIKTLQQNDSAHTAELRAIKQNTIAPASKKIVIDRRGSKQVWYQ